MLGVGGGSALDTAKAVAALATNPGSPLDYVGLHKVKMRPLPTIAIPTTAGTGSEVSLWSVFTDDERKLKVAIGGVLLYPTVALCDPELTLGLPAALTAATGLDALAHAIECYTNNACQPISAALALEAIALIGAHLRSAALERTRSSVALRDDAGQHDGRHGDEPDAARARARAGDAARQLGSEDPAQHRDRRDASRGHGVQLHRGPRAVRRGRPGARRACGRMLHAGGCRARGTVRPATRRDIGIPNGLSEYGLRGAPRRSRSSRKR